MALLPVTRRQEREPELAGLAGPISHRTMATAGTESGWIAVDRILWIGQKTIHLACRCKYMNRLELGGIEFRWIGWIAE